MSLRTRVAAFVGNGRPRGTRPELPSAAPGSNLYPAAAQWGAIDLPNPSATVVMGLPAASRAKNLIAGAVAQMAPLDLWSPDGFISDSPPSILTRSNSTYTQFDFINMMVSEVITHGNFCALLADPDGNGYAQQLVPVPWGFYLAYYDGAGYLTYAINGQSYSRDEVFHVRLNSSPNQPMGVGVVSQFRRSFSQALDQQSLSADTYRSGAIPSGVIALDKPEIDPVQAQAITAQWIQNHSGGRAPAVLPNTMTFTPMAFTPEDSQFLESRSFTVGEIAHCFNLDPTDLGASLAVSSSTMQYQNIEQRQQSRIADTYATYMLRIEQEYNDLLPGGNTARFNVGRLLRTDSKTLAEVQQLEIANETLTVDEARKARGRKPLPKPAPVPDVPAAPVSGAPGASDGASSGDVLAPQPAGAPPKPEVVPDDPNISISPVKVKV